MSVLLFERQYYARTNYFRSNISKSSSKTYPHFLIFYAYNREECSLQKKTGSNHSNFRDNLMRTSKYGVFYRKFRVKTGESIGYRGQAVDFVIIDIIFAAKQYLKTIEYHSFAKLRRFGLCSVMRSRMRAAIKSIYLKELLKFF